MKNKRKPGWLFGHGLVWILIVGLAIATACQNQARGFVLPEGDVALGKQTFANLYCNDCHSISDIAWSGSEAAGNIHIKLGGDVTSLKTYGELLTSIINPSHKISKKYQREQDVTLPGGQSKMELYNYNEVMTVKELVDLVTFLQSEYNVIVPKETYPYY